MQSTSDPESLASPREEDDSMLVKAAQRDPAAFIALYRRYVTPVYRYLYNHVGNPADAQDLTAQVFLEALEGLRRYRERGSFAGWLFTIARRRVIGHYRDRPAVSLNDVPDLIEEDDVPSHVIQDEALQRLRVLVAQLDDDERELLRLRFAAGLTFGQMSAVLGRGEAAVKMALHRLLGRLRAMWGDDR